MRPADAKWKIELRASTYPVEEWAELRNGRGRWFRFADRQEAETVVARLHQIQPHMVVRIVPFTR